jgi:hypothetical protein
MGFETLALGILQQKRKGKILDIYTFAAAGYSVRLLSDSYTGYCIKVRRSSDNATQNIGFVDGVLDTDSLLSFCGAGSGYIETWYDQSGNSRDFSQTDITHQPQIVSSGSLIEENSRPAILFSSSTLLVDLGSANYWNFIHDGTKHFNIIVLKPGSTSEMEVWGNQNIGADIGSALEINTGGSARKLEFYIGNGNFGYGFVNAWNDSLLDNNNQVLITNIGDANNAIIKERSIASINGKNDIKANTNTSTALTGDSVRNFKLGGHSDSYLHPFIGKIQELIFWNNDKSSYKELIKKHINRFFNIYSSPKNWNPCLVYSLRRVFCGSTYCIKVRRSSDNATQDIGFVDGVLDTDSLLSFCGAGSGYIETWYDQSGNGIDASQSTTGSQPQIVNSGSLIEENGKPAVKFLNQYLSFTPFDIQSFSVFTVLNMVQACTNYGGYFRMGSAYNYGFSIMSSAASSWRSDFVFSYNKAEKLTYSRARPLNKAVPTGQYLESWIYPGFEYCKLYENGNTVIIGNTITGWGTIDTGRIGSLQYTGAASNTQLNIQEIIIYKGNKTEIIDFIHANINDFYTIY